MQNFGGLRRSAATWTALVIATSGLVGLGAATTPAAAAPAVSCSVAVQGSDQLPFRPSSMSGVTSVTLTIELFSPPFQSQQAFVSNEQDRYPLAWFSASVSPGLYVFSTEGGRDGNNISNPGTYHAPTLRPLISPYRPGSRVMLELNGGYTWRLDITFSDCDSDGDGVNESIDSCPTIANVDQADLDGDRVGNACDPDVDGDGAANAGDNCPVLANDQADLDGDRVGNACDSDVDGDGTANAGDNCPALANDQTDSDGDRLGNACDSTPFAPVPATGTTTTAAVAAAPVPSARTLDLRYARKKRVFKGVVGSAVGTCSSYAEVTLWRKTRGTDRRLVVSTTNELGKFRTPRVRRRGTYYATVAAIDAVCAGVTSRTVRVRRR